MFRGTWKLFSHPQYMTQRFFSVSPVDDNNTKNKAFPLRLFAWGSAGITMFGIGATLLLAKFNPEFRERIGAGFPKVDIVIKAIFQEDLTYKQQFDKLIKEKTKK